MGVFLRTGRWRGGSREKLNRGFPDAGSQFRLAGAVLGSLFVGGSAFLQSLHPLLQMQGYEQSRVPALRPSVHVGNGLLNVGELLLNVGESGIDSFFQRLDAHTQGL